MEYEVTVYVSGRATMRFTAENMEDAKMTALVAVNSIDCGELERLTYDYDENDIEGIR